ncbi:MAG: RNA polymerase sigma factor [Bacteroidales bacterium]|jgi:RNA polymerase sigma-70 factor (ECF subfamily)|nr:RNA polymerase sigma factor [Bacteroidales bacterium]
MRSDKKNIRFLTFLSTEYRNMTGFVRKYFNEKYYSVSAEDIIQEVALTIFSTMDFDDTIENIGAYFYRALKNRINDFRRKKRKELNFSSWDNPQERNIFTEKISDLSDDPGVEINDLIFYRSLNEALAKLSPNQRMVFLATEMEGISFAELSEKSKIPLGTLLSWKHRGVKKLRQLLKYEDFIKTNDNE